MQILLAFLKMLWMIFRIVLIPVGIFLVIVGAYLCIYMAFRYAKGDRRPEGEHKFIKRPGLLKALFVLMPQQYVRDFFSRNPEEMRHHGCVVFTGRQGYGKTIAMIEQTINWQDEYPKAKVITNLEYIRQDDSLTDYRQLLDYNNGIQGVIVCIDEMQNWFSSNDSRNFPVEMLEVITQNRKNRRVIMGTAQCFQRLAKPLREQASEVRKCFTILGCMTFVHRVYPILKSDGEVDKWKHRGFYMFVHTPQIRHAYDTYKVIERLSKTGFQPKPIISEVVVKQA